MDFQDIEDIVDITNFPVTSPLPTEETISPTFSNDDKVVKKESPTTGTSISRRGRKPGRKSVDKVDIKAKLERSRQSARECRARKKLRYQYLEDLVLEREKAVLLLRSELEKYNQWAHELDLGQMPDGIDEFLEDMRQQNIKPEI